jgi:hypothetical protein
MPPKKQTTRRIEIEPEQPEIPEQVETLRDVADVGRPAGKKDDKPRKMTMARMEALQKAQAKRKENLEKKRAAANAVANTIKETIEPKTSEDKDNESYHEIITTKVQPKKTESIESHKSSPISKPKQKKKIIIVKEEESESDESIEVKYIKPKQRKREKTYDNREPSYQPESYEQKREPNALEILLKHYGGF